MGRWLLGLVLYAAAAACSDDAPAPIITADTGTPGGGDAGIADDSGTNNPDTGMNAGDAATPNDTGTMIEDDCDPVAQTGCVAPATKCVIEGDTPGTECVPPSPNDVAFGDPCTGRDCAAGLACLRDSETATTTHCRQACNPTTNVGCETLGMEYECRTMISDSNWGACTMLPPICDPYTQDPCNQAQACQPFLRRTGTWEFRCRTAGPAGEGETCGPGTNCARGLACINNNTTGVVACRKYCQSDVDCTAPATCTGNVPDPPGPFMFCRE